MLVIMQMVVECIAIRHFTLNTSACRKMFEQAYRVNAQRPYTLSRAWTHCSHPRQNLNCTTSRTYSKGCLRERFPVRLMIKIVKRLADEGWLVSRWQGCVIALGISMSSYVEMASSRQACILSCRYAGETALHRRHF